MPTPTRAMAVALPVISGPAARFRVCSSLFSSPLSNLHKSSLSMRRLPARALSSSSSPALQGVPASWPPHFSVDPYLSCSMPGRRLKVALLLSGGVDSSVALRLLHAAGHSCTAFYLKIWFQVFCLSFFLFVWLLFFTWMKFSSFFIF